MIVIIISVTMIIKFTVYIGQAIHSSFNGGVKVGVNVRKPRLVPPNSSRQLRRFECAVDLATSACLSTMWKQLLWD